MSNPPWTRFNPYMMKPCPDCPFRRDCLPGWLGRERAKEIAEQTAELSFTCHKTNPSCQVSEESKHCAGAVALLLKLGQKNEHMELAELLGFDSYHFIKGRELVFDSFEDFVEHHARDGRHAIGSESETER